MGSSSPRMHNTEERLLLLSPTQIPLVGSHLPPSFSGGLCTLTTLLMVLELLAAYLPAHQGQLINYLYTIWLLDYSTALPKSLTFFILINLETCTHQPIHNKLHGIYLRPGEWKVMLPGIPRLITVPYGYFILGDDWPNAIRSSLWGFARHREKGTEMPVVAAEAAEGRGTDPSQSV